MAEKTKSAIDKGQLSAVFVALFATGALFLVDTEEASPPAGQGGDGALPEAVVVKCREVTARGGRSGVIRARPQPNRIDVDELLWAEMDVRSKDIALQAVACELWRSRMPTGRNYVVAYGWRSGKRLQMLTSAGMSRE